MSIDAQARALAIGRTSVRPRRRVAVIGDSFSDEGNGLGGTLQGTISNNGPAIFWHRIANMALGYPFVISTANAIGGQTTAQAWANFETKVTPFEPDELWIFLGRNDVSSVASAQAALAVLDLMLARAKSLQCQAFVATPCPGRGSTYNATANQDALNVLGQGIHIRESQGSCYAWNLFGVLVDPADTAAQQLAAFCGTDNLHPTVAGQVQMGLAVAQWRVPNGGYMPINSGACAATDVRSSSNQNPRRLIANPTFIGTGGSSSGSGTVTGTKPNSWTIGADAGLTVAASVSTTRSNGINQVWLDLSVSGSVSGLSYARLEQFVGGLAALGVTPGADLVRGQFAFQTSGVSSNFGAMQLNIAGYVADYSSAPFNMGFPQVTGAAAGAWPASGVCVFDPQLIPATVANLQCDLQLVFYAGTASGTYSFSMPTIELGTSA